MHTKMDLYRSLQTLRLVPMHQKKAETINYDNMVGRNMSIFGI